mmetsp:Transcript_105851/g.178794  ORF Transcript_105851/g.178794 Transcript_105851/m.178794 type:complete len:99 (+) Transcript_105851:308-604(+)
MHSAKNKMPLFGFHLTELAAVLMSNVFLISESSEWPKMQEGHKVGCATNILLNQAMGSIADSERVQKAHQTAHRRGRKAELKSQTKQQTIRMNRIGGN